MRLSVLAERLDGTLEGDGTAEITSLAGLEEAGPGDLAFLSNLKYAARVSGTAASAVVVADGWSGACPCSVLRVANPDKAMAVAAAALAPPATRPEAGIHPTAIVAEEAALGEAVSVGPHCMVSAGAVLGDRCVLSFGCYIGPGVVLGDDCLLYPRAVVKAQARLGHRVVIHDGAVIGSDGFGYYVEDGVWNKIPQIGTVEIGDDVEIGANSTIDRARFGKTVIGQGTKIDNLVHLAHNVRVGEHTAMAAQVGIAGSTTIGRHVLLGGQAGLAGHVHIGDGAVVGAQAGVTKDVPPGEYVTGYPAMPHRKAADRHAQVMRLPRLKEQVQDLQRKVAELEKCLAETAPPS